MGKETENKQFHEIRESIVEAIGRITTFWGFGKVMGQLYGMLYLSPRPLTLDEMARDLKASKGHVSTNIRSLERWNMVRPVWIKGDRKDYYEAETDFWKIVKGVLREREKKEFDQALSQVGQNLKKIRATVRSPESAFISERLARLEDFISTMDKLVSVLLTLEDLKRNFLGLSKASGKGKG